MYYVVTDRGVVKGRTRRECSLQLNGRLDPDEFTPYGPDSIVYMTDADIDFIQDKKKMSMIMFSNFFKKDNTTKVLIFVILFLQCIIIFVK